jgi:fibronectin type 3 domain-containing protein
VLSHDGSKALYEFEGEASAPLTVTPHDIFPPAAPQAVQAIYSSGFIDLAWRPNTESDIAGYNVYRANQKLNAQPVTASAFRDEKLQGIAPGTELTYYVTAVDTQANESARSEPATERIPKP